MIEKTQNSKLKTQNLEVKSLLALPLGEIGKGKGFGKFSLDKITNLSESLADFLSLFVGFLTIAAGLWFMIKFIIGAFSWISSGGDPDSLKNARQTMINALIGIVLVVGALAIVSIVGTVLGLPILNIGELLKNVGISPGGGPIPTP